MIDVRNSRNCATSRRVAAVPVATGSYQRQAHLKHLGFKLSQLAEKEILIAFDNETYPVQSLISEADISEPGAHERNIRTDNKAPSIRQKDKDDDTSKDTQISNWENEGGAHSDRAYAFLRNRSINSGRVLTAHLTILLRNYRPSGAAPHRPIQRPCHW